MAKEVKPMTKKQIIDFLSLKLDQPKKVVDLFIAEYTNLAYREA